MRKLILPAAFLLSSTAIACSFQVGAGTRANTPQGGAAAAPTPTPAPSPSGTVRTGPAIQVLGKRPAGGASTAPSTNPTINPNNPNNPTPAPTTPTGIPVLVGTNVFGTGTADVTGWKGSFYAIPPATQKLPALASMTPSGVLFTKTLDVAQKPMTGGFPGIDASKNENFAIRWEAPLVVDAEADYTFRLVSDDGAILQIDGTTIVDNDGARDSAKEKSGPVHLVKGTHVITVDYFQATGPVALQLFCKKAGGGESICPTRL